MTSVEVYAFQRQLTCEGGDSGILVLTGNTAFTLGKCLPFPPSYLHFYPKYNDDVRVLAIIKKMVSGKSEVAKIAAHSLCPALEHNVGFAGHTGMPT
jgi:hypothetical protein